MTFFSTLTSRPAAQSRKVKTPPLSPRHERRIRRSRRTIAFA